MPMPLNQILSELKSNLSALYGEQLSGLFIFGSQARGDGEEDSDIDVLVVLKGKVSADEEISRATPITAELSLKHNVVISCVYISEKRYLTENSPLLINVRREGVAV